MPDCIGPYQIQGELGRGAMAIVWRAFDPNLEREVAIKEPTLPVGTDEGMAAELSERFVREGKAAAQLNHPGIVTIHAADIYDGRPAIVMELIEGETLADMLDRGPLDALTAAAITDQLLDAVGYAHERGVVHRDIKPDNIFLTSDGRVKLADFGIAHVGSEATGLTQAGTVMGTPGYMAPEQVTGQPVDARSDIFSIGAVLFEMLAGQNPFGATQGDAATTVMYRIVHEQPPALSQDMLAGVPSDLAVLLSVAMAKSPDDRFASAEDFRTALAGGPVLTAAQAGVAPAGAGAVTVAKASPWTQGAPVPQQSKNNWTPYIIVGAIGVLVIGGLLVFSGGGMPGGGSAVPVTAVEATETAPVEEATEPEEPAGPTEDESYRNLVSYYSDIGFYGNDGEAITQLAQQFNQDPLTTTGASSYTVSTASNLVDNIKSTRYELQAMDVHAAYTGTKSTQLRLLDLCLIRAEGILDACYISQRGGNIKPPLDEGRTANEEYISLYPSGRPQ